MSLILPTRRDFLKASSAAAAIAAVGVHTNARAADASKKLKIGFIGCGGRGTGAASQALQADSNVELWAMGDAFRDPIDKSLESANPIKRLSLIQERLDLLSEKETMEGNVDLSAFEDEFVSAAKGYSERKGISYAAWRELGVPPAVLKRAGISRAS